MEKRRQNSLWNRLELIGINTCKYGIECEKQKTTSNAEVRSRIFRRKKKVSIYDNTLTNFANNTVQNKSFGRYFSIHR